MLRSTVESQEKAPVVLSSNLIMHTSPLLITLKVPSHAHLFTFQSSALPKKKKKRIYCCPLEPSKWHLTSKVLHQVWFSFQIKTSSCEEDIYILHYHDLLKNLPFEIWICSVRMQTLSFINSLFHRMHLLTPQYWWKRFLRYSAHQEKVLKHWWFYQDAWMNRQR